MKKTLVLLLSVFSVLILGSCGGSPEAKLIGTWKVVDVQTDFNEMEVTPEMLSQVVEMQKQTFFRIVDDSTMVIISNSNTHEAKWTFDTESNEISYFFEGTDTSLNVLGKLIEGKVVNETETPLSSMTIVYAKE
jgi:hypothetical protein